MLDYNDDSEIDMDDVYDMILDAYDSIENGTNDLFKVTKIDLFDLRRLMDLSGDGNIVYDTEIDYHDVQKVQELLAGDLDEDITWLKADLNYDYKVTEEDLQLLIEKICYIDIDEDGAYTEEDLYAVHDELRGLGDLDEDEQNLADVNKNGRIDGEDLYMLTYGYYLNIDNNPDLGREQFYTETLPNLDLTLGNLDWTSEITDNDLKLFKDTLAGNPWSYKCLFLADVNMDLKLDEKDAEIYEKEYMSDIPFTYTLDSTDKTMCITGVKDKNMQFAQIGSTYCVDMVQYTVTEIGKNAFTGCSNLDAVYIPESVTTITLNQITQAPFYNASEGLIIYCEAEKDPKGFSGCWYGSSPVEYNHQMKNVEDYYYYEADHENKSLTITGLKGNWWSSKQEIEMEELYLVNGEPYKVTKLDNDAIYYVDDLEWISLPSSLEEIGSCAINDCYRLDSIYTFRCHRLKKIGDAAFGWNDRLERIYIPKSVEIINTERPSDGIIWDCLGRDTYIYLGSDRIPEGWGQYWNYVTETTKAEVYYNGRLMQ